MSSGNLPLLVAYEVNGDVVCLGCLPAWKLKNPSAKGLDLVPLFRAELKPTDKCVVCESWISGEVPTP